MAEYPKPEAQNSLNTAPSRKRATIMLAAGGYVNTALVIVQGLLLVPLYLHYIGAHTYGLWLASGGMLGMMALMNFGISSMLIQRVSHAYGEKNLKQAGAYFFNGMIAYLLICLLFGLVGWGISEWVSVILKVTGNEAELLRKCFQLAVVAMVFGILNECLRSFSQALLRPLIPMIGMAIGRISGIIVTVWMLFGAFGLWAIPMGMLVSETVIFIVNLYHVLFLLRDMGVKIFLDRNIIKEYIRTSPALLMARSGNTLSQESEPLLITLFLGPEVTTIYMITRKAADIVFHAVSVLYGASHSSFSHLVGEENKEKTRNVASKLLLLVFIMSLIGFAAYVGATQAFVTLWVGDEFLLTQGVILLIGVAFFMRTLRAMVWQILNGLGDFIYTSIILVAEGVCKIGLAVLLLGFLGVEGFPIALVLSCLLSLIILSIRLKKTLLLEFSLGFMMRTALSIAVLFGGSVLMAYSSFGYASWGVFVLYAMGLTGGLMLLFATINYRTCLMWVRRGVICHL